jgi:hypothetical protein
MKKPKNLSFFSDFLSLDISSSKLACAHRRRYMKAIILAAALPGC